MSLPKKQVSKIKKLCKQYGIDIQILNDDLEQYVKHIFIKQKILCFIYLD
jgi:hypothetical protein